MWDPGNVDHGPAVILGLHVLYCNSDLSGQRLYLGLQNGQVNVFQLPTEDDLDAQAKIDFPDDASEPPESDKEESSDDASSSGSESD